MEWYYAEGQERRGPVSDAQLRTYLNTGRVTRDTLVWRQGMASWSPVHTALDAGPPPPPGHQRCIVTGKDYPMSQMIQTEHGWVSAEGRDTYYQCQREGVALPSAAGGSNARADGKRVVVPAADARLPLRCFKTNEPVTEADVKRRTLYYCNPWYALTILLSVLIYIILYLVTRKKVEIDLPLSARGRSMRVKNILIGWGMFFGGFASFFVAAALEGGLGATFVFLGIGLIIASLVYGTTKGTLIRVTKLEHGEAWLAGAGPEYLASLPPYT